MRRCNSLPQVVFVSPKEEKARPVGHVHFRPRPKVSLSRIKYRGRYSLNKNVSGKGDGAARLERSRRSSGTLLNGQAHSAFSYCLDDESSPYDSIRSDHVSPKELAMRLVPSPVTPAVAASDLTSGMPNRNCFYKRLVQLSSANTSVASRSVLTEPAASDADKDHQGELYLMTMRNEKHRRGDLLWLAFQAVLAGRRMRTWREQFRSLRIQDAYIMERRNREACILDEIRNFRLNDLDHRVHSEGYLLPTRDDFHDGMKSKLHKVRALLDRLDSFENLFPSLNYMMQVVNFDKKLRDRIAVLNMWYKTTMNLYDTIREVGRILGVNDSQGRRLSTISPSSTVSDSLASPLSWPSLEGPFPDMDAVSRKFSATSGCPVSPPHTVRSSTSSDLPALLGQSAGRYSEFVSKSLQLKGMRRVLERLENVCSVTISKAVILLQKPPGSYAEAARTTDSESKRYLPIAAEDFPNKMLDELNVYKLREKQKDKYSIHHEEFAAMGLPSFINLFYFLVRVPLDLVDEWLKMRGSMHLNADLLTLQTVMEDCHDCLRAAISVKHTYVTLVQLGGLDNQEVLANLAGFEGHLSELFGNYLTCVRHWARAELSTGACAVWGDRFFNELIKEWKLAKRIAVNVLCGEKEAAHRFCFIGKDLFQRMVKNYFSDASDVLEERRSDFNVSSGMNAKFDVRLRKVPSQIQVTCRHFRELVKELRNRALRALSFARSMVLDLEKCAVYELRAPAQKVLYQLCATSHTLVILPRTSGEYVIFCDKNIADCADFVRVLLHITCARYEDELPDHIAKRKGYLLIFPSESLSGFSPDDWRGNSLHVDMDTDTEMYFHFLQVPGDICLVALNGQQLASSRRQLEEDMKVGREYLLSNVEEQFCCHEVIAEVVAQLKEEASEAYTEIWNGLVVELVDEILDERSLMSLDVKELETIRDTLLKAYWLTFEYRREMYRMLPRSSRKPFADESVDWIENWLSFMTKFRGDGAKHWAAPSLKFLTFAADPQLTSLLSDERYEALVSNIKLCIERTITNGPRGFESPQDSLDDRDEANNDSRRRAASLGDVQMFFDTPRLERIRDAVREIDDQRDQMLRGQERIGCVKHIVRTDLSLTSLYGVKNRAPFNWRRTDNKIGKGKFGTVYVVLNLSDPGLMAMKQISIDGNHKALHALIDEVENLRKLDHENIVKYYAIEVHREELLIFMEYCPGGTLESKCRDGIERPRIRWYTCSLLKAVEYIHERMIVHRDIKPANVFIGRGNILKLGDFGSSVHLSGGSTAFGEIVQLAGTPAYMAPEVQTLGGKMEKNGKEELYGYGRAADIWSVGCVVLEMCTGKPPWHELEMLQIIFRVGTGMRPPIPPKLQADEECVSFLDLCFQSNPSMRATASTLRQHSFANIAEDATGVDAEAGNF